MSDDPELDALVKRLAEGTQPEAGFPRDVVARALNKGVVRRVATIASPTAMLSLTEKAMEPHMVPRHEIS